MIGKEKIANGATNFKIYFLKLICLKLNKKRRITKNRLIIFPA
jgi:hypothetical protein